jgi:hypothetical protein
MLDQKMCEMICTILFDPDRNIPRRGGQFIVLVFSHLSFPSAEAWIMG